MNAKGRIHFHDMFLNLLHHARIKLQQAKSRELCHGTSFVEMERSSHTLLDGGGGKIAQGAWFEWEDRIDHYQRIWPNRTAPGQIDEPSA